MDQGRESVLQRRRPIRRATLSAHTHNNIPSPQPCLSAYAEVSLAPGSPLSRHVPNNNAGICAGKRSVADHLVKEHGFYGVSLLNAQGPDGALKRSANEDLPFHDLEALLEFVTKRWKERWVIRDISNETVLDALLRRPFFLLVSVDAPVTVRWQRYKSRCVLNIASGLR